MVTAKPAGTRRWIFGGCHEANGRLETLPSAAATCRPLNAVQTLMLQERNTVGSNSVSAAVGPEATRAVVPSAAAAPAPLTDTADVASLAPAVPLLSLPLDTTCTALGVALECDRPEAPDEADEADEEDDARLEAAPARRPSPSGKCGGSERSGAGCCVGVVPPLVTTTLESEACRRCVSVAV
jgi:hypothetical protein